MTALISAAFLVAEFTLAHGLEPGDAKEPVTTTSLVAAIDVNSLAAFVQPGAVPNSGPPRFNGIGVVRDYRNSGSFGDFQLTIGIYADRKIADSVGATTMPQMPLTGGSTDDAQWFFSARGCHMSYNNAFVLLQFNKGWGGPAGTRQPIGEFEKQSMIAIGYALQQGLTKHAVKVEKAVIDLPRLHVESVSRVAYLDGRTASPCGYKVVVRSDAEGDLLFGKGSWGLNSIRQLSAGRYEVVGGEDGAYRGMTIRAARPTGEVCVLDVEDLVQAADKVELTWFKYDMGKRPYTDAMRRKEIDRLRSGQEDIGHQSNFCEHLAQHPSLECAPLFLEILYADRHQAVKQPALRGLAELLRQDGLEHYRRLAADRTQPVEVRGEAIILIREFGAKGDIPRLREIEQEGQTDLAGFVASAVKRLEVKDRVVPGD